MTISGQPVPVGEIKVRFCRFADESLPYTWVDISSDSSDESLAGVAINCLNVGDIVAPDDLSGLAFSLASGEDDGGELAESVFWREGDDTLEIESLSVTFGAKERNTIQLNIRANCFSFEPHKDIAVSIVALALIE